MAAYIIDRNHLFSVPTTVQAHVRHPFFLQRCPSLRFKIGSIQYFVEDADLCSDWSPSKYAIAEVGKRGEVNGRSRRSPFWTYI